MTHTHIKVHQYTYLHTYSNLITAMMYTRIPILLIPHINHLKEHSVFFLKPSTAMHYLHNYLQHDTIRYQKYSK